MLGAGRLFGDSDDTTPQVVVVVVVLALLGSAVFLAERLFGVELFGAIGLPGLDLPTYDRQVRREIALRLLQVAVLYLAGIVAALRFMDDSSRFDAESGSIVFGLGVLILLTTSGSATAAVFSLLRVAPTLSITVALVGVGVSFVLSVLASVVGVVSSRDPTTEDSGSSVSSEHGQWTPVPADTSSIGTDYESDGSHTDASPEVDDGAETVDREQ